MSKQFYRLAVVLLSLGLLVNPSIAGFMGPQENFIFVPIHQTCFLDQTLACRATSRAPGNVNIKNFAPVLFRQMIQKILNLPRPPEPNSLISSFPFWPGVAFSPHAVAFHFSPAIVTASLGKADFLLFTVIGPLIAVASLAALQNGGQRESPYEPWSLEKAKQIIETASQHEPEHLLDCIAYLETFQDPEAAHLLEQMTGVSFGGKTVQLESAVILLRLIDRYGISIHSERVTLDDGRTPFQLVQIPNEKFESVRFAALQALAKRAEPNLALLLKRCLYDRIPPEIKEETYRILVSHLSPEQIALYRLFVFLSEPTTDFGRHVLHDLRLSEEDFKYALLHFSHPWSLYYDMKKDFVFLQTLLREWTPTEALIQLTWFQNHKVDITHSSFKRFVQWLETRLPYTGESLTDLIREAFADGKVTVPSITEGVDPIRYFFEGLDLPYPDLSDTRKFIPIPQSSLATLKTQWNSTWVNATGISAKNVCVRILLAHGQPLALEFTSLQEPMRRPVWGLFMPGHPTLQSNPFPMTDISFPLFTYAHWTFDNYLMEGLRFFGTASIDILEGLEHVIELGILAQDIHAWPSNETLVLMAGFPDIVPLIPRRGERIQHRYYIKDKAETKNIHATQTHRQARRLLVAGDTLTEAMLKYQKALYEESNARVHILLSEDLVPKLGKFEQVFISAIGSETQLNYILSRGKRLVQERGILIFAYKGIIGDVLRQAIRLRWRPIRSYQRDESPLDEPVWAVYVIQKVHDEGGNDDEDEPRMDPDHPIGTQDLDTPPSFMQEVCTRHTNWPLPKEKELIRSRKHYKALVEAAL